MSKTLDDHGWAPFFARSFKTYIDQNPSGPAVEPARIVFASREIFHVWTATGERTARLAGRLRAGVELPAVGDWVVVDRAAGHDPARETLIRALLPRRTRLSRKVAGAETREQVVAANLDAVFVVMGLDGDFNPRRLERFSVMARESGAEPVVVLTKAALAADVAERRLEAQEAAPGLPVIVTSALEGEGLDPVSFYLEPGRTVAMIGSSGAGKSTLVNRLAGTEVMRTAAVRASDDRGRHTTTHRQLVRLPGGGLLIDNPGVREIQLWAEDVAGLGAAFDDIERLAEGCRFRDCGHDDEPGCAVRAAVEDGRLDPARLDHLHRLERELEALERRRDVVEQRRHGKAMGKLYKRVQAQKKRRRR